MIRLGTQLLAETLNAAQAPITINAHIIMNVKGLLRHSHAMSLRQRDYTLYIQHPCSLQDRMQRLYWIKTSPTSYPHGLTIQHK